METTYSDAPEHEEMSAVPYTDLSERNYFQRALLSM